MSIKNDLKIVLQNYRKDGMTNLVSCYSFLIGELDRINDGKDVSDEDAIKCFIKIKKNLDEIIKIKGELQNSNDEYIYEILEKYIPKEISDEEIKEYIKTIDFSQFKNKMQAMGIIMKHFGVSVDGNKVKKILMEI